jgi:hypothetical protein
MAVCFNCGEMKFGAFVDCKKCNAKPQSNDDRALSLFLTDHFFKIDALHEIGKSIKNGEKFVLGEEQKKMYMEALNES